MHYVKFVNIQPTEFKKLIHKDSDTLYFVYEKDENTAELYLGNKLISGGESTCSEGINLLSQLKDIVLYDIKDRDILMYSELYNQWINAPLKDFIPIMIGTNGMVSGSSGLVPAPQSHQTNAFLSSSGQWENINISLEELQKILTKEMK